MLDIFPGEHICKDKLRLLANPSQYPSPVGLGIFHPAAGPTDSQIKIVDHSSPFLWKQDMKLILSIRIHIAKQNISHNILQNGKFHFFKGLQPVLLIFKHRISLGYGSPRNRGLGLLEIIHLLHPGLVNGP